MIRRRPLKRLPVHQRGEGFIAMRRLLAAASLPCAIVFTMAALILDGDMMIIAAIPALYYLHKWWRCQYGEASGRPIRIRRHRRIYDYDDSEFRLKFRFHKKHAPALLRCLGIVPNATYRCDNGYTFDGEEGFLVLLMRMATYHRLTDMEEEFGLYYDEVDRIYLTMLEMLVDEHHDKLFDNFEYFVPRFEVYNHAIRMKILNDPQFQELGVPLCPCAHDTALFCDGTRWEVARPVGDIQARLYNGKDRVHCLEFQGVSAPDGMIVDLFGPVAGIHHDQWICDHSLVNDRMQAVQVHMPIQYKIYADRAYVDDTHMYGAHRGNNLPMLLQIENLFMSLQRIGVEWAFGKVCSNSAFVDCYKVQRVQLSAVGKVYFLAAILANAHTTIYGSEASTYWGVKPPTLGSYFGYPEFDRDLLID